MKNKLLIILCFLLTPVAMYCQVLSQGWTRKADMPTSRGFSRVVTFQGKIYVVGGENSNVDVYDPLQDTWSQKKDTSILKSVYSLGVIENKMYAVACKGDYKSGILNIAKYDESADHWEIISKVPTYRSDPIVAFAKGKIYVIDGFIELTNPPAGTIPPRNLSIVERYDPISEKWDTVAAPLTKRHAASAVVCDTLIFLINGVDDGFGSRLFINTEVYNINTNKWYKKASTTKASAYCPALRIGNKIYLISTHGKFDTKTQTEIIVNNITEEYDIATNKWRIFNTVNLDRTFFSAEVYDSAIFIFGGENGTWPNRIPHNSVYNFDLKLATGINLTPLDNNKSSISIGYNSETKRIVVTDKEQKESFALITVVGIDGKIRYSNKHLEIFPKAEIPTDNFPSGIYIVSVSSDQVITTQKIMLN